MAKMIDFDYWEFTAYVHTAAVSRGTAVEFVPRTDGNPIPWVKPATADNDIKNNDPRTTYVGVAMEAGNVGDQIHVRPWAAGTMPALTLAAAELEAGTAVAWDGDKFVPVEHVIQEVTIDTITNNSVDELYLTSTGAGWTVDEWTDHEILILTGVHEGERYFVSSNTSDTLTIGTSNLGSWTAPIDIEIESDDEAGWSTRTAVTMSRLDANAEPQIAELLVLKGGYE